MKNNINLIGLKGIPLIKKGDNISNIILDALKQNNLTLDDGDIFVIAQTIISKSTGQIIDLGEVIPRERANQVFNKITPLAEKENIPIKTLELIQKILDESKEIIKAEHVLIVETKHGFVCANAGIDKSNIEGETKVALLPENSDNEAQKIRKDIENLTHKKIAIVISDSFGRPFRIGAVGVALGISGIEAIIDKRGARDLFGHVLQSTIIGQVDNLASAAQLIMGEADEGLPIVLIKGYKYQFKEKVAIKDILRKKEIDIFRDSKNFTEVLKNRRSYKFDFDTKIVERETILESIDLARWAPSAHNAQPWRYILIEKGKIRDQLIEKMNEKLKEDLINNGKNEGFINKKIDKTRNRFLNAPYLIILCLDKNELDKYPDSERNQNEYIMGIQSISASAIYLLLSFESKNLAACWYCAPLFTKEIVKRELSLPNTFIPMAFFTVGYPLKSIKAPNRKDLNELIFDIS